MVLYAHELYPLFSNSRITLLWYVLGLLSEIVIQTISNMSAKPWSNKRVRTTKGENMQKTKHVKPGGEEVPVTVIKNDGEEYLEWCASLPKYDIHMLSLMLFDTFKHDFQMGILAAADKTAAICGVTGRTVRNWSQQAKETGEVDGEGRGHHNRESLMNDEHCCKLAASWIRENSFRKGEPNMTALSLCQWVNSGLLPSITLGPDMPRRISVETARRWLHQLGFW